MTPEIEFNTPYGIRKAQKEIIKEVFLVVFNQYLTFICGAGWVYNYLKQRNIFLSFLFLIVGLIPMFTPLTFRFKGK